MDEVLGEIVDVHASDHHLLQYVVFRNYALVLEHFEDYPAAITYTSYALETDESDPNLWSNLTRLAIKSKDSDLVFSSLESAFFTAKTSKYYKLKILSEICNVLYNILILILKRICIKVKISKNVINSFKLD